MGILGSDSTGFLVAFLEHLRADSDCVTFYEAIELLDAARNVERLTDQVVADMIRLHDAPHVTDGARGILAPFIKNQTMKRQSEYALAKRPWVISDHNKTARAVVGDTLYLHLPERRASGFFWRVVTTCGPATVTRTGDRAEALTTAYFEVSILDRGVIDIGLTEAYEGRRAPHNNRERRFAMRIYADGTPDDLAL